MSYVLGVDGGNTKTLALVARSDGAIAGAGRSGCGDIYGARSAGDALAAIASAADEALAAAGIAREDIAAAAFSLAGADWPEDHTFLRERLASLGLGGPVAIVNDALGALRAGSSDGTGVSLVLGTGTAIGARNADGRVWHVSFWLWEAHGAGELGRLALRAVLRAELGIDPPTPLAGRLCDWFRQPTVEALLHALTQREGRSIKMHQLAAPVLQACAEGEPIAQRIARDCGTALGEYALAAARQVGLEDQPFELVLAGGVLRSPAPCLTDALVERVLEGAPGARPVRSRFEPVAGAVFLALESIGVAVDEHLIGALAPTLPPPAFYATQE